MIKRVVKDKDGNVIEDTEITLEKEAVNVKSEDNMKEKRKNRQTPKES